MGEPLGAQLSHRPPGSAPGRCAGFRPALGAFGLLLFLLRSRLDTPVPGAALPGRGENIVVCTIEGSSPSLAVLTTSAVALYPVRFWDPDDRACVRSGASFRHPGYLHFLKKGMLRTGPRPALFSRVGCAPVKHPVIYVSSPVRKPDELPKATKKPPFLN